MKGYPRGFLGVLWGVCAALALSGLLLAPTTLAMRLGWELPWRLPAAGRIGMAALHAGAAFAMLLMAGALWSIHMRAGWRRGRQRKSGALLVLGLLVLSISALGVYYFGESSIADATAFVHLAVGIAVALPMGLHAVAGRRMHCEHHALDRRQERHARRPLVTAPSARD